MILSGKWAELDIEWFSADIPAIPQFRCVDMPRTRGERQGPWIWPQLPFSGWEITPNMILDDFNRAMVRFPPCSL